MKADQVLVGEAVAGESAKVKHAIENLVAGLNSNTFDLSEYLLTADSKGFFSKWGFNSAGEYFESIKLKPSKGHYLLRIAKTMAICGIPREVFEKLGIAKLRTITKIDPLKDYNGKPGAEIVKQLIYVAEDVSIESLKESVDAAQGKTDGNEECWLNLCMTRDARDKVAKPALKTMKKLIGSVSTDTEGNKQDASDGRCAELIFAEFNSANPPEE
jgi:hypothetical protein